MNRSPSGIQLFRRSRLAPARLLIRLLFALGFTALPGEEASGQNTIARFEFIRGTNNLGVVDVELFDSEKPETVRNFLLYVRSGAYTNSFLHRCVPGFVMQGGGFWVTNTTSPDRFAGFNSVTNYGRLTNEFLVGSRMSNTLGTLAMAKVGDDPNSATSQWFFNLGDNSANLDSQNGGFTVFGRVLSTVNTNDGLNVLEHFNRLSTNAGVVNLGTLIGSSYQVFNALPVSYTNTSSRVPLYRELYFVRVSILNNPHTPGLTAPTVAVTSPAPHSLFTNQVVKIQGTASDDQEVARVVYRVGGGAREIASGTTNWEVSIQPPPGFQTVTVESLDWDGNFSGEATATFFYQKSVPLSLSITGHGSVAGIYSGQELVSGAFYTATATPAKGSIFEGWTGSITSSTPTLSFQLPADATNFSLTAKFITDPLPNLAGTYHGLLQTLGPPDYDGAGFMSLALRSDGYFTGDLRYHGVKYSYTGQFDSAGNATIGGVVGGTARTISLTLQKLNSSGVITGTFSGTSSTTLVQLERLAASLPTTNAPVAGNYTFVIPINPSAVPTPLAPGGSGYGSGSIASSGVFSLSGVLGDGTSFNTAPKVSRLGRWPLYVELDGGKGALWGWISYNTNSPVKLQAGLNWIRTANGAAPRYPAGFSNQVSFAASRFSPEVGHRAVNWVHGMVRLAGTDLVPSVTNLVKLSTNNTLEVLSPDNSLQLTVDPWSGLVSGSFVHPWFGVTTTVQGSLLVASNYIRGQYLNGSQVGSFSVDASPFLVTQAISSVTLPALTAAMSEGGVLRFQGGGTIFLTNTLIPKFHTRLEANGHQVILSGGGSNRLFEVQTNISFSLVGITLADGFHQGAAGDGAVPGNGEDGFGAGIANLGGSLALTNCSFTDFVVRGGDAGLDNSTNAAQTAGGRALGAALFSQGGPVSLHGCSIGYNVATAGGNRSLNSPPIISKGDALAMGAGLYVDGGECRIYDSVFFENRVEGGHPLLLSSGGSALGGNAAGGALAIASGTLRMANTRVLNNLASGASGEVSAGGGHVYAGGLFVETNVFAVIDECVLEGNMALSGSLPVAGESPKAFGGAIYNSGSLTVTNSSLGQNTAGGGHSNPAGVARGGAVFSAGPLMVNRSTFSNNRARGGEFTSLPPSSVEGGEGAGGAVYLVSNATITNATFAFNEARGGGADLSGEPPSLAGASRGGALAIASGSATLVNVTLAYNQALAGTSEATNAPIILGGAVAIQGGALSLRGSIVASNNPANIAGVLTDLGYNISTDSSFAFSGAGSLTNVNAMISVLSTNGGPTQTIAISPYSPARDAIRGTYPATDQRGTARPQGTYADSGAYEFVQTVPIFNVQPSGTNVVRAGTNVTYQAQATGPGTIGYYWLKDGAPLAEATSSSLGITNVQPTNGGLYAVVATNSFGAVTSAVATLVVDLRPLILTQPSDLIISPGAVTSLVVVATGPSLRYEWFQNQVALLGQTNSVLPINASGPGVDGTYKVVVSNDEGSVTSRVASVSFSSSALSILSHPQGAIVAIGAPSRFAVLASGVSPISYQWFKNNVIIPDETNNVLNIPITSRTNAGNYRVVVTNPFVTLTSGTAVLTVVATPVLTVTPQGGSTISITCSGDAGRVHRLLSSTNLSGASWLPLATNTMPGSGSVTWTVSTTNAMRTYYRVVTP